MGMRQGRRGKSRQQGGDDGFETKTACHALTLKSDASRSPGAERRRFYEALWLMEAKRRRLIDVVR
jgi:hypothetical protein